MIDALFAGAATARDEQCPAGVRTKVSLGQLGSWPHPCVKKSQGPPCPRSGGLSPKLCLRKIHVRLCLHLPSPRLISRCATFAVLASTYILKAVLLLRFHKKTLPT